jgi:hypothetical protein
MAVLFVQMSCSPLRLAGKRGAPELLLVATAVAAAAASVVEAFFVEYVQLNFLYITCSVCKFWRAKTGQKVSTTLVPR